MRVLSLLAPVVALGALGGCVQSDPQPPDYFPDGGSGSGIQCQADSDCASGQVCARTGECLLPSDVQTVHVSWTLQGQAASATTCASSADLEIDFPAGNGDWWGWAPVPCSEGKFTVDKLPHWFTEADISIANDPGSDVVAPIDRTTGEATADLPY